MRIPAPVLALIKAHGLPFGLAKSVCGPAGRVRMLAVLAYRCGGVHKVQPSPPAGIGPALIGEGEGVTP